MRRRMRRNARNGLIMFLTLVVLGIILYILFTLPRWVFYTILGIFLIASGWYLYDS